MAPILGPWALDLISHSPDQTRRLGARLGQLLQGGDVVCLEGELGTGKTCLAQGIGRGLGIREPIVSPTFTLIREYKVAKGRPPLYHIDFYRLENAEEALALGLEEYLYGQGVCVIEWAERAQAALPRERLWITLKHLNETKRGLLMEATGQRYEELLREFKRRAFGV
ncbi:MAG: tRNA (adenosine(37)-N6)-threonylcarbamoyltransferase complex ATPase subunit type 1 TsaE [Anaerolineae bacterium]